MEKAKVLIVEDDAIIAMDIESQLKRLGYGVTAIVGYGEQAIEKVKENTPDLVLMDIVLKGEMDGIEAAEEIRTHFDIPVIFLTAFVDKDRLKRAKLTYPFGFIIKPFQNKDLSVTIEMALYVAKADAERNQTEEALRESEERFRLAFESANDGVCLVDTDGNLIRVNMKMSEIFGYSKEELEGMTVNDIAHPEDKDVSPKFIRQGLSGEVESSIFEKRYFHKQGHIIWGQVSSAIFNDSKGDPLYFISHVQDITQRKKAEEKLRQAHDDLELRIEERTADLVKANEQLKKEINERKRAEGALKVSEARYQDLYENAPDMFCSVDAKTAEITQCNQTLATILGYKKEEVIGRHISEIYHSSCEADRKKVFEAFVETGEVRGAELLLQKKDGSTIDVSLNISAVRDEDGRVLYSRSIWRDISKRKQAE